MRFGSGTTLSTERLTLRPFGEEDIETVVAAADDPEMLRWMPWATEQTVEASRAWCTVHAHEDPENRINFAIVPDAPEGGRCAGAIGLSRTAWDGGRVEIGYWIAAWARRRGYAVEAVRAVSAFAF